jgi:hypothetical protein
MLALQTFFNSFTSKSNLPVAQTVVAPGAIVVTQKVETVAATTLEGVVLILHSRSNRSALIANIESMDQIPKMRVEVDRFLISRRLLSGPERVVIINQGEANELTQAIQRTLVGLRFSPELIHIDKAATPPNSLQVLFNTGTSAISTTVEPANSQASKI